MCCDVHKGIGQMKYNSVYKRNLFLHCVLKHRDGCITKTLVRNTGREGASSKYFIFPIKLWLRAKRLNKILPLEYPMPVLLSPYYLLGGIVKMQVLLQGIWDEFCDSAFPGNSLVMLVLLFFST